MKPKRVFLSHSYTDRAFAQSLGATIKAMGIAVGDPALSSSSGNEWAKAIRNSLEQADAVVIVVPEAGSTGANNAFFEAGAAHALGKPVVAVVPEQQTNRLRELPSNLLDFAVMDASKQPIEAVAKTVVHALEPA